MAGVTGVSRCSDNKELGLQTYPKWGFGAKDLFAALTNRYPPPPDKRNAPQDAGLGGVPKDRMKVQLLPAPYATAARARQATATDNTPPRTPLGSFERPKRIKNETADARRNKRAA